MAAERAEEGYAASAWLAGKVIAEAPGDSVFPLLFGPIIYVMTGLHLRLEKMAKFLTLVFLSSHANSALGLMIGCLSPSQDVANILGPALIIVFLLMSGINTEIPAWLKKFEGVSTLKWGMEGMLVNEFDGLKFDADKDSKPPGGPLKATVAVASAIFTRTFLPRRHMAPITDGRKGAIDGGEVLEKLGYDAGRPFWVQAAALATMIIGFHGTTYSALAASRPRFQPLLSPPSLILNNEQNKLKDGKEDRA